MPARVLPDSGVHRRLRVDAIDVCVMGASRASYVGVSPVALRFPACSIGRALQSRWRVVVLHIRILDEGVYT